MLQNQTVNYQSIISISIKNLLIRLLFLFFTPLILERVEKSSKFHKCDSPSDLEYTKVRSVKVPSFFGLFSTGLFTVEAAQTSKEADTRPIRESGHSKDPMRPLERPQERSDS